VWVSGNSVGLLANKAHSVLLDYRRTHRQVNRNRVSIDDPVPRASYLWRMSTTLHIHGVSDPGRQHPRNEDSWLASTVDNAKLLIVCDGMGGMGAGDKASQLAVETISSAVHSSSLPSRPRLEAALVKADITVRQTLCTKHSKPGATAVVVLVERNQATVAWVGDSRAYWMRNGAMLERTTDHKLVQALVDRGEMSEEEARNSSYSNVLTRSIGGRPPDAEPVEISLMPEAWALQPGDHLVVASDGLIDLVTDEEIADIVHQRTPKDGAQYLVDLANRRGGHDNITAIVALWADEVPNFVAQPFGNDPSDDKVTEGFAPTRDATPVSGGGYIDDEDEDDKATVLADPSHEFLSGHLMPATPAPVSARPATPTATRRLGNRTVGTSPAVIVTVVFLAVVLVGGAVLWAVS
jgi:serine/threonine protein phosphatase PrpC